MKADNLRLKDLHTYEEHAEAIDEIEQDYSNVVGGLTAWLSGYETHLTATAKNKIKAIEKRIDRLFPCDETE